MCDKTYFIHVPLFVLLHVLNIPLMHGYGTYLSSYTEIQQNLINGLDADYGWPWSSK
jgi:hypothetical protein